MALYSRRQYLATINAVGAMSLAGCIRNANIFGNYWSTTASRTTKPLPEEAAGWPQYGRNSRHTGFAREVTVDDPTESWTFEGAESMASPAVVGNRVIVHGGVKPESSSNDIFTNGTVFSLSADDGQQEWQRDLPGSASYSGCPPIVYRGSVYVGGQSGVCALNARDGRPRWRHETRNSVNEAAVGFQNQILASTGETLLAFDERGHNGVVYRTGDDRAAISPPAVDGDYILYPMVDLGCIVAINPTTGGVGSEWLYKADRLFSTPTVVNGTVYVSGNDRLHAIDLATGNVIWTTKVTASSGVATDTNRLFVTTTSGALAAYATADGSEQWRTTLAANDGEYLRTRPLVTAQSVIVTTEKPQRDERVTTYAVDRWTGKTRWSVDQPGNVSFDAVAADGQLYVPLLWSTGERKGTLVALSD